MQDVSEGLWFHQVTVQIMMHAISYDYDIGFKEGSALGLAVVEAACSTARPHTAHCNNTTVICLPERMHSMGLKANDLA